MRATGSKPLYRHIDVALLRAAAAPLSQEPDWWPDFADMGACREWLHHVWSRPELADAVRHASPSLADRVDAIRAGRTVGDKQLRRAIVATARYVLRATGRPTPFGVFAGVAPVGLGREAQVRWADEHRSVARVDTEWLADIIDRLEGCPDLLERLDVVFTDLAGHRGGRLEVPRGPNRATIRYTKAVHAVREAAAVPVRFGVLADKLTEAFTATGRSRVHGMLAELVQQGFLITNLRAPFTVTDPLAHLVDRLHEVGADTLPPIASVLRDLEVVRADVHHHNHETTTRAGQAQVRETITCRMREISPTGRTQLAVDLLLDCDVQLPLQVAHEMEQAAGALLRLTRQPAGEPAWRDFLAAFLNRYGSGTLVPLADVVDPDAGLGYPAGYPGSVLPPPTGGPSARDERLLALAWQAMADGTGEIVLTEDGIRALTDGDQFDERYIPPHVELAGRIHATSAQALQRGDYTLTVAPARSAGTLTSRFTPLATGSGLEEAYRALPSATEGALQAQLSFPPAYPHAENVCRVPGYLARVLPLGEHRGPGDGIALAVDDLAVTATRDRLHLVSISCRRVVEPQVFHALALDKQPPPPARFLAQLPRAFAAAWYEFDWGPQARRLPYLPRVRYRRSVLSPTRWRLTTDDLPPETDQSEQQQALDRWRRRWNCPGVVELRDADRTLRLTLDEPIHVALLHAHLSRHGHATLTEATPVAEFGWLDGHSHEIALPLVTARAAAPCPLRGSLPRVSNGTHGHVPASPAATWLQAKIHTHRERQDEIIAEQLPSLLAALGNAPCWWFVRYRSPHETDHLRLRIRTRDRDHYAACAAAVGQWAQRLRHEGAASRLIFDTYHPEIGRYGPDAAMDAAEAVFAADSQAVSAGLRKLPAATVHPTALVVVNMVDIVRGFLGDLVEAWQWLIARPVPTGSATDRAVADQAVLLAQGCALRELPGRLGEVDQVWQARATALACYRERLPANADVDGVLESLLHMHHNRAIGIDPDSERTCRRLARQAALRGRVQHGGHGP